MNISTLQAETGGSEAQVRPQVHSASNASTHEVLPLKQRKNTDKLGERLLQQHGCLRSQSETFEETHGADMLILYSDLINSDNMDFCSWHSSVLSGYRVRENLKISFFDCIIIKNVKERDTAFYSPLLTLSTRGTQSSKILSAAFVCTMQFCY